MEQKSTVINLYGGPGTGKSTTMASIFTEMKRRSISVEMAPEWVKLPVWAGENHVLEDQLYIFAKQNRMLRQLNGKVDFIITDAPLLLSMVYSDDWPLHRLVRYVMSTYFNCHVFLNRVKPFSPRGRVHDEAESLELDREVRSMLSRETSDPFHTVDADAHGAAQIVNWFV